MLKETIKKISNNKYFIPIFIIVINILFFLMCNKAFTPKYEQVDDFIIMNLISKSDGNYNIYGVQMHPIICGIIILLYKTSININWYTIFMLGMQFLSFTIIGTVFCKKSKIIGLPLYISFLFIMYTKVLRYIQYTTVSMLCIASGTILLMHSMEKDNKIGLLFALLMVSLGCMIRFSTIIIAVPFILLFFIFNYLKNKEKKHLKIMIILILLVLLINVSFNVFYNINPTYREFLKFHDVRTYLHDYNWLYYENNKEVFNNINWSENDRNIFYAYCYGDENVYNTETLEKLKESAINNQGKENIIEKFINTIRTLGYYITTTDYMYIILVIFLIIIYIYNNLFVNVGNKQRKNKNALLNIFFSNFVFMIAIGLHGVFIWLNRPMLRVIISIYIMAMAILMYGLLDNIKELKKIKNILILTLIFVIGIVEFKTNVNYARYYNIENFKVYREIIDYTGAHKENAYLYTLSMRDRFLAYSIYEKIEDDKLSNIRPLGDWDTYTKNYYDFKERYNIENLIESLYKKDNIYLISGNIIWKEKFTQYITIVEKYIEEHYNIDIECNVVKEFENNIKIYKLQEK